MKANRNMGVQQVQLKRQYILNYEPSLTFAWDAIVVARLAASRAISFRMTGLVLDCSLVHILDRTHWKPFDALIPKHKHNW